MLDPPQILKTSALTVAQLPLTVPAAEMQRVMGPGLAEVLAAVAAQGRQATGPWFTHHFRFAPGVFDFAICVPVDQPVTAVGRVRPGVLPATTVARAVYRGGYEGLGQAWPQLDAWVVAQGRKPAGWLWEVYLTDPSKSPDPSTWRTELNRPLTD